jgi:hypothetical protein
LVQAFLKKWWVESDFKAPNLPLSSLFFISKYNFIALNPKIEKVTNDDSTPPPTSHYFLKKYPRRIYYIMFIYKKKKKYNLY